MHVTETTNEQFNSRSSLSQSNNSISAERTAQKRPNILLIVSDDHGVDMLGCYGNPVVRTPNLDALAADGTRFTNAFCASPTCSPSRSAILTGLQSHHNGMYGLQHDTHNFQSFDSVQSLPKLLAKADYRTARIGKYHLAPESVYKFQNVFSDGTANDPESIGRSVYEMAEQTREFVAAPDENPFFLYFAPDDPHRSNTYYPDGSPSFQSYPDPNPFGNRTEGYPNIKEVTYDPEEVIVPDFLPDTPSSRAELAEYYQSISRLDQGIGRLIEILKETGQYENTLIIYTTDHGPPFPGAKTTLYEPGIHIPCIVRSPNRKNPGSIQTSMISGVDTTPTLLDAAGVLDDTFQFDGQSYLPGVDGSSYDDQNEIYASHSMHEITMYYPIRMVRTKKFKLIHNLSTEQSFPLALDLWQSPTWISSQKNGSSIYGKRTIEAYMRRPEYELYDLSVDPDELVNLVQSDEHQSVFEELHDKLITHRVSSSDPWLEKSEQYD
ncbi:sulfatase [Puniceicoccaceae bacterium K14]|nr:sulfatase [Puniceicoccaceae bacterium K14]